MATATVIREGDQIAKVTAAGTVAVDDIDVVGTNSPVSLGVAKNAAASGEVVIYDVNGEYTMPKVSGAVIAAGETVDWDANSNAVDDNQLSPATGDLSDFGFATEAAGSGVTTVKVRLLPGNGAKT